MRRRILRKKGARIGCSWRHLISSNRMEVPMANRNSAPALDAWSDRDRLCYPSALRQREDDCIAARRRKVNPTWAFRPEARDTVGLALSGGGIRSATFCLGVLQALAGGK